MHHNISFSNKRTKGFPSRFAGKIYKRGALTTRRHWNNGRDLIEVGGIETQHVGAPRRKETSRNRASQYPRQIKDPDARKRQLRGTKRFVYRRFMTHQFQQRLAGNRLSACVGLPRVGATLTTRNPAFGNLDGFITGR